MLHSLPFLYSFLFISVILNIVIIFSLISSYKENVFLQNKLNKTLLEFKTKIEAARRDTSKRTSSIIKGKIIEHFTPFLNNFPYDPSDCKFLGQPIDFIVFEGMSKKNVTAINFIEVKTGKSRLSKLEKSIKDVINSKNVKFQQITIDADLKDVKIKKISEIKTNKKRSVKNAD